MTTAEYITAIRKQYNADIMHLCENKPPECFSGFNACLSCKMKATCRLLYKSELLKNPTPDLLEFIKQWAGHNHNCDCLDEGSPRTDCTCGYDKARDKAISNAAS